MHGESSAELAGFHFPRLTRLTHLGQAGLFLLALLAGCGISPAASSLAGRLQAGLASDSSAEFSAAFGAAAQPQAQSWYQVFSQAEQYSITANGADRLAIRSRFVGDRRAAYTEVVFQLRDGQLTELVPTTGLTPSWLLPGASSASNQHGTLISADLDPEAVAGWLDRITEATGAVEEQAVAPGWEPGIVLQIPPPGSFTKVSGEDATAASAATRCDGGTPRIVLNPMVLTQSSDWLNSTLVHETVHVATDSACHPDGLRWVVEGVAEAAAAKADPATAARNRRLVKAELATNGVPDALPDHLSDLTDYALAQVAVEQLRRHLGATAADFITTAITEPTSLTTAELDQARSWYRAELRRRA